MERLVREESDLIVFLAYLPPFLTVLNSAGSDPRAGGKISPTAARQKKACFTKSKLVRALS
jgi:hypothetical protein